ncbi:CMGC/SRPK protein kinase [Purpureocillium lilacinum]|uniref:non-specific serine/threonine protein kinase n=1 Tax=Purpureocillium lilacinum TaxID=33203 RepID=A0A179H277_PURLI|nr:CMGC/SRPK protein kinase [Purpureocillium lilacinum]
MRHHGFNGGGGGCSCSESEVAGGDRIIPADQRVDEEGNSRYKWQHFYHPNPGEMLGGKYKLIAKMGWGQTSTVWLAEETDLQAPKRPEFRAVKIYNNGHAAQTATKEINVLKHMYKGKHGNKHPGAQHVVAGLAVFAIEQLNRSRHLCLVMEPMREPLVTFRRRLGEANSTSLHATNVKLMKSILRQVLAGLDYLHSECRIVHTDIKADNILLTCEDVSVFEQFAEAVQGQPLPRKVYSDHTVYRSFRSMGNPSEPLVGNMVAKISDFGLSYILQPGTTMTMPIQPTVYRAPEVILGAGWSCSADIWNLAVVIWDIFADTDLFNVIVPKPNGAPGGCYSAATHLVQMTEILGPAPDSLISRSEALASQQFSEALAHPVTGKRCLTVRDYFDGPFYYSFSGSGRWKHTFIVTKWRAILDEVPECLEGEESDFLVFIARMMRWEPEDRATARMLLQDPWLDPAQLGNAEWKLFPIF